MIQKIVRINRIFFFVGCLWIWIAQGQAQEGIVNPPDTIPVLQVDSIFIPELSIPEEPVKIIPDTIPEIILPGEIVEEAYTTADSVFLNPETGAEMVYSTFKPNSTKAVLLSLIPGMGQIYNRAYWKLPIVYGGFMGVMYAITWNNRTYKDYFEAYKDISSDYKQLQEKGVENFGKDQWQTSWQEFIASTDEAQLLSRLQDTNFHNTLKRRKDYYRRYRDLSIIIAVGVYAICMIDAYVDAELFDFDISPDLSMRVEPMVTPRTSFSSASVGFTWSLTF